MKHPLEKMFFLAVLLVLHACAKKTDMMTHPMRPAGLPGNWDLVSDSTFKGVGLLNHRVDYGGMAGDYFFFSIDGYVYTKEGKLLDTLTYNEISDTSVVISDFGIGAPDTSRFTFPGVNNGVGITKQTMVIESPLFVTPGGLFWRKVTLSR